MDSKLQIKHENSDDKNYPPTFPFFPRGKVHLVSVYSQIVPLFPAHIHMKLEFSWYAAIGKVAEEEIALASIKYELDI